MNNELPNTFYEILAKKLTDSGLPEQQIQIFVDQYREFQQFGILNIDQFENHQIPSDDCFRTLKEAQRIVSANDGQSEYGRELDSIGRYLRIPYSCIADVKLTMMVSFAQEKSEIETAYYQSPEWLFISKESVEMFASYLKSMFSDVDLIWLIYKKAALLGLAQTQHRIEAVVKQLGLENGEQLIRNDISGDGWLFYPWFTDPVGCIEYMAQCGLTSEAIVDLLEKEPRLLFEYKEGCKSKYHHDQQYIDAVINKYLSTMH